MGRGFVPLKPGQTYHAGPGAIEAHRGSKPRPSLWNERTGKRDG